MSFIKNILEKQREKSARFKEAREEVQIQKAVADRELSHEERLLNKYYREEHEKQVKKQLGRVQKIRQKQQHHTHIFKPENIFSKQRELFKNSHKVEINNAHSNEKRLFFG